MPVDLAPLGMLRVAVASPALRLADPVYNCEIIAGMAEEAAGQGARVLLCPELSVTGYSCADLFLQPTLLQAAEAGIVHLTELSRQWPLALLVGAPLMQGGRLFNCAVIIAAGQVIGVVPKRHIPNSQEFYERRWFCGAEQSTSRMIGFSGGEVPFGTDLLFSLSTPASALFGIELCEDLWSPNPPSADLALAGATLIANLSASPETLGKMEYRRDLVRLQSARCLAAYAYAGAGPGESSTDLVFSGHCLIAENGVILAESERFSFASTLTLSDIDCERLANERRRSSTFAASSPLPVRILTIELPPAAPVATLLRSIDPAPFVPSQRQERAERCAEIFAIQTTGLGRRLLHTTSQQLVLGISGGLDSTLALLVAVKAFDKLALPRSGIVAVTMPGFGTTVRTRNNAEVLAASLGVSLRVISIDAAVRQHFADIGHDEARHDITYENSQARERTQILMDIANQVGGLVLGTGDLSELALGWCTFNGDHMAMYGINAGVPKTLVRYLVEWCAEEEFSGETAQILHDVAATPVSPELLPPTASGEIAQVTEDHVGPYRLHDFFLYNVVRLHFGPRKIYMLACIAFAGEYPPTEIHRWLTVFIRRFFSQQFKRSVLPDGPKVGSVALSPRGDWRMPSDASAALWLAELRSCLTHNSSFNLQP
jgi:NAD+ synthase (glutamine-hydrolysing)